MTSIGLRVQNLSITDRTLVLASLAALRAEDLCFGPQDVEELFAELAIPGPSRVSNALASLERVDLVTRAPGRGRVWRLTPKGRAEVESLISNTDLGLLGSSGHGRGTQLGGEMHPVIPPTLSPPGITRPLQDFLDRYPFETNVFGMTRFASDESELDDPVAGAVEAAREVCAAHGLTFHLASDRSLVDDLWGNVMAHMWACQYGIAFFEDRVGQGLNLNPPICFL